MAQEHEGSTRKGGRASDGSPPCFALVRGLGRQRHVPVPPLAHVDARCPQGISSTFRAFLSRAGRHAET